MKRLIFITLLAVNILVLNDCCHADEEDKSEQGVCKDKVSHSNHNEMRVGAPPAEMELDPFYKKFLDCDGITVIGSERVDDRAFYRVRELLDKMLENRPDVRKALVDDGVRYIIIAAEEQVTDVPDYANMEPKDFWNERSRGFGGRVTSCGEENLLSLPIDRYGDESIFIHELAHTIDGRGLRRIESDFRQRLKGLYDEALVNLREAVKGSPNNPGIRYHLGATYHRKGFKDEAIAELKKALSIDDRFIGSEDTKRLLMELEDR